MYGLYAKVSKQGELLLGKHFAAAVGTRVVIAQRYTNDVWARDESGGRTGTVIELLEPVKNDGAVQHTAVQVRWDRADSRTWQPSGSGSDALSSCYTGYYRCGSKGHYHLALASGESLPILPTASESQLKLAAERLKDLKDAKKAKEDTLKTDFKPEAWGANIEPDSLLAEPAALAYRRQEVVKIPMKMQLPLLPWLCTCCFHSLKKMRIAVHLPSCKLRVTAVPASN
jgi:hypothetical protein